MTFKETIMRKFALPEQGYRNVMRSTVSCMLHDISQMLPIIIIFLLVSDVMDFGAFDLDLNVWVYVAACVVSAVLLYLTYVYQYNCTYFTTYSESADIRLSMAEKLRKLPLSYFAKRDPTDLTMRIMGDVATQETALTTWVPYLFGAMVFTAVMTVFVIVWCPAMGIAAMWPVPISFALILTSKRFQRKYMDEKNRRSMTVNENIQECLENVRDLRANNAVKGYLDKVYANMDAVESMQYRCEYTVALFILSAQLLLKFGIATTALAGGYFLVNGTIDLFVFIAFLITVSRAYDPLSGSLGHLAAIISGEYNFERIQEIKDEKTQTGSENFSPDGYDIVFDHVGFSYDGDSEVLSDVSFTAKQGEVTALIGPSGGGKSTVARLSSRFWDADRGTITLGGVDISTVDPETLLSCYSIVFQDVTLFNTSVMENIRLGRKGASDEDVLEAAKAAMCDEFVSKLPQGYETVIGENGSKLSGGERQRISIARALLKDAPIILLDEATASLDTESETRVQKAISALVKDKTVLIVAHRMRTIERADRIVVLRDGRADEQGSPAELSADGESTFSRMAALQSDSEAFLL